MHFTISCTVTVYITTFWGLATDNSGKRLRSVAHSWLHLLLLFQMQPLRPPTVRLHQLTCGGTLTTGTRMITTKSATSKHL